MIGASWEAERSRGYSMSGRAVTGVLLLIFAFAWPGLAVAQQPDSANTGAPTCEAGADRCGSSPSGQAIVIPSRPSELADGHEDFSAPILATLAVVAFAGLVVSVLNRLAFERET
jgi:hypothetical protein